MARARLEAPRPREVTSRTGIIIELDKAAHGNDEHSNTDD